MLEQICARLTKEASQALIRLEQECSAEMGKAALGGIPAEKWLPYAISCIQTLWREQADVASSVRQSVRDGVDF
jgi:hypothetical protein